LICHFVDKWLEMCLYEFLNRKREAQIFTGEFQYIRKKILWTPDLEPPYWSPSQSICAGPPTEAASRLPFLLRLGRSPAGSRIRLEGNNAGYAG
jgi:hypothetical protein